MTSRKQAFCLVTPESLQILKSIIEKPVLGLKCVRPFFCARRTASGPRPLAGASLPPVQQPPERHAKRNHPTATPQKKMLVVLRTARPLVVPRGTQRRLLSVSVGAVAGGCVMTRASRARMLEAAPPPPPATAILAQRRRAGADLDDDANVLQHLARACFRLARIVETSIRLGALATPLVLAVRGTVWKSSFTMLSP